MRMETPELLRISSWRFPTGLAAWVGVGARLSLPAVAHLQLRPVSRPVAGLGELLGLNGWTRVQRGAAGDITVAYGRVLPEVVQRWGGGGGH